MIFGSALCRTDADGTYIDVYALAMEHGVGSSGGALYDASRFTFSAPIDFRIRENELSKKDHCQET